MNNQLPTKISPCPIIESVVEIIFDRNYAIEPNAIYGKVYDRLKERYSGVDNLPIFQLPEDIRLKDENLKNKPWHKFYNDEFEVLVGGSVVVIVAKKEYKGWTRYNEEIKYVFDVFKDSIIFSSITRIGLKYVDMFEMPIINKIGISLSPALPVDESSEIQLRTTLPEKNSLNAIIAIMNNVSIEYQGVSNKNVSLLDIDVYKTYESKDSCNYEEAIKILKESHLYQKELFFKLIKEDFLIKYKFKIEKE